MKRWILITFLMLPGRALGGGTERQIELQQTLLLPVTKNIHSLRIWMPLVPNTRFQDAHLTSIRAPFPYRITHDAEYGNAFLFTEVHVPYPRTYEITLRFDVRPHEQRAALRDRYLRPLDLQPRGLIVVTEAIRSITSNATRNLPTLREKAYALYRYVLRHMVYDKTGTGWGRGDAVYACRVGKGNCSDFHSLFIALCQASGIPARFHMGFLLPPAASGSLAGYHCWADFYVNGEGWIPVDISEAWKHPEKQAYYFGHLDCDRILISTGRQITLEPRQKGGALNWILNPYVEEDGAMQNQGVRVIWSFREKNGRRETS